MWNYRQMVVNLILNGQYLLRNKARTELLIAMVVNLILNGQYLLQKTKFIKESNKNQSRKPYSKWTISSTKVTSITTEEDVNSRKPYSKWTISSTRKTKFKCVKCTFSRKPYSKWTISSTYEQKIIRIISTIVVNLILNGQYLLHRWLIIQ